MVVFYRNTIQYKVIKQTKNHLINSKAKAEIMIQVPILSWMDWEMKL